MDQVGLIVLVSLAQLIAYPCWIAAHVQNGYNPRNPAVIPVIDREGEPTG